VTAFHFKFELYKYSLVIQCDIMNIVQVNRMIPESVYASLCQVKVPEVLGKDELYNKSDRYSPR